MEKEKTMSVCWQESASNKPLEALNDVFADVVNTLLLDGKGMIRADELSDGCERIAPGCKQEYQGKERAVVKTWNNCVFRLVITGFDNQKVSNHDLPLSVLGYEALIYEKQLEKVQNLTQQLSPVITVVLYFGKDAYNDSTNLLESINTKNVPEALRTKYNDYKMRVFDIPRMSKEQTDKFTSDFKAVAKYLAKRSLPEEKTNNFSFEKLDHPKAVQKFLQDIFGNERALQM